MTVRSRSLFWTFAGVFLLVVVGASILQYLVSVAVLRPLAAQGSKQRAGAAIEEVSRRMGELPPFAGPPDMVEVLRANAVRERGQLLVFSTTAGPVLHDRMVGPEVHRGVVAVLVAAGLADSATEARFRPGLPGSPPWLASGTPGPPAGPRAGPRPMGPPPGGAMGRPPGPDDGEWRPAGPPPDGGEWRPPAPPPGGQGGEWGPQGPPPGGRDGEWRPQGPPPGGQGGERRPQGPPTGGAIDTRLNREPPNRGPGEPFELLAHRAVARDGRVIGELAIVGPTAGAGLWSLPESRGLLLTLPLAMLVSAGAGLFMVRMLVRRLNTLERVTDRLAGGDVPVPEPDLRLDEIGRLETRFNRMADRVVAARGRLEDSDRQRRRLLADISHELATPLTSIRGYVETLLDPGVTTTGEERTRYLMDVLEESKRLDAMIGELFDLARLEAGATPLKRDRLDWTELCRNTARRLEPRFRDARLSLSWVGRAEPAWVLADGRRLEEVAENLLANVVRYVPAGGAVELALARVTTPAGERLRFTVADDGPGIAEEDLPHVFERFYRAEAVRAMGGSGLGLAIVAEIVRLHGGEVGARRREPRGVAFTVDLPPDRG